MKFALHRATAVAAWLVVGASVVTGCIPLVVGGAVVSGMVATDRRTTGTVVEDEGIELRAANRVREALGERVHINITSYNRQVLITGEAPTEQDKQTVAKIASEVENVRNVVNEVGVMGVSTMTQRSSDAAVTVKAKLSLLDARDVFGSAFKLSTERGTTYVMGRVTQREAQRATDIITGVPGVQRVVRLLELITEEELARLQSKPPAPTTNRP